MKQQDSVSLMNLQRLELALTTKCNSQCVYCQAEASPLGNEVMNVKDAHSYLIEAAGVPDLKSFMVFGGEPMLYPAQAIAIFRKAHQLNIPKIDMLTNGFWGKDKQEAEKLASKLKAAGLNILGISVDAFHLQYIPVEYPRNAAQASLKAGIEQVTWNVAVMESMNATNQYDRKTSQILKALEPVGIEAHIHKVVPVGRALQKIPQHFQHTSLDGPCEGEQPIGNSLASPDSICIEPSGSVNICWDLSIGNARKTPLSQIITEYDWRKDWAIKILVEEGPMGLLKYSEKQGYRFQKGQYISKCHLCIEIRKSLGTTSFHRRRLSKSRQSQAQHTISSPDYSLVVFCEFHSGSLLFDLFPP